MIKTYCLIIALIILIGATSNSSAAKIQIQTNNAFSCSTDAVCKTKCEAEGGTWKRDKTGKILGTCTVKSQSLVDDLMVQSVKAELSAAFSKSKLAYDLGLQESEANSISFTFIRESDCEVSASCTGSGIVVEMCCIANCNDPCRDGGVITALKLDQTFFVEREK